VGYKGLFLTVDNFALYDMQALYFLFWNFWRITHTPFCC